MANTKLKQGRFTAIATENFMHAVRIVQSEGHVIKGQPIDNERDVCQAVGLHQPGLSAMKAGDRAVTVEQAAMMCHVFGFNPEWMLFRTGPMRGKDSASSRMDILEQKLRDVEAIVLELKKPKGR